MDQKLIVSVNEARKLLGKTGKHLTDEEIEKLIQDLDFLAKYAIRQFKQRNIKDGKV